MLIGMPARPPYAAHVVKMMAVGGCVLALLAQPWSPAASRHSAAAIRNSAAAVSGQLKPSSKGVGIQVVTVIGSGCSLGSVRIRELPDLAGFIAAYGDFRATVNGGNILDFRKNCQFGVRIQAPPGYAYAAVSAQYRGYAKLARGTRGVQQTSYYFQGQPQTISMSHPMSGPFSGFWRHAEYVRLSALGGEACGQSRILNINAEVRVYPGARDTGATSYLDMGSANRGYAIYRFNRTHCP